MRATSGLGYFCFVPCSACKGSWLAMGFQKKENRREKERETAYLFFQLFDFVDDKISHEEVIYQF